MKHEWRKHEKELYLPKAIPELVKIPKQKLWRIVAFKGNQCFIEKFILVMPEKLRKTN